MNRSELTPVSSSNVGAVGYQDETLYVEFLNGGYYKYIGVPEHEYNNLLSAESVGKYLNSNIKPIYPVERIN